MIFVKIVMILLTNCTKCHRIRCQFQRFSYKAQIFLSKSNRYYSEFGPNLKYIGLNSNNVAPNLKKLGQNHEHFGHNLKYCGRNHTKFGPNLEHIGPNIKYFYGSIYDFDPNPEDFG